MSLKKAIINILSFLFGISIAFLFFLNKQEQQEETSQCSSACYKRRHNIRPLGNAPKACHLKKGYRFCISKKWFIPSLPEERDPQASCDSSLASYNACVENLTRYNGFIRDVKSSKDIVDIPEWYMKTWFLTMFFEAGLVEVTKPEDTEEIYYGYQTSGGDGWNHLGVSIDEESFFYWITAYD